MLPADPVSDLRNVLDQPSRDEIGAAILAAGGPRAIRYREKRRGKKSIVFVAHHEDVVRVLTDEDDFSVCHYNSLYSAVAPRGAYVVMRPEDCKRKQRMEILDAAAEKTPWFESNSQATRDVARECVDDIIAAVSRRPERRFDLIGEYGYFAPYLIAKRFIGLPGPLSFSLMPWLLVLALGRQLRELFAIETGPYLTQLAWSETLLGQIQANFENRSLLTRLAARWGGRSLRDHVERHVCRVPRFDNDPSLLNALWAVRSAFPDVTDKDYREHVVSLIMELGGTALLVPGMAFQGVIDRWLKSGGTVATEGWLGRAIAWLGRKIGRRGQVYTQTRPQDFGPGLKESLRRLRTMEIGDFVNEEIRLAPPVEYLLRNATEEVELGGLRVHKGEYVCVLVKSACIDIPDDPNAVKSDRKSDCYIHFGPEGGPHRCYGHLVAPAILAEMFLGLERLPDLEPRTGYKGRKPLIPGRLIVDFGAPAGLNQ